MLFFNVEVFMSLFDSWLVNKYIAHRGFHNEDAPENTISAFERAIEQGYAIELDVQAISDGTAVVFHDTRLSRLTGKDGYIKNLKAEELKEYHILDTVNTIPTLQEALDHINGRTPVLIEIKPHGKVGDLESSIVKILKDYKGDVAIQSFNPYILEWFLHNAPHILRGQLSSYFEDTKLSFIKKYCIKKMIFNKKAKPDFIAYDANNLPNRYVKKYKELPLLAWTVRSQSEYLKIAGHCDNIIFENFKPSI